MTNEDLQRIQIEFKDLFESAGSLQLPAGIFQNVPPTLEPEQLQVFAQANRNNQAVATFKQQIADFHQQLRDWEATADKALTDYEKLSQAADQA